MKVLILDDEIYRHEGFDRLYEGHDVFHAYDAGRACKWLDEHVFDVACLDHDLGDGRASGQDVAKHIASMPREIRPKMVRVHSWNPAGARAIAAILSGNVDTLHVWPFQWPSDSPGGLP